jgi:crossover junction endodeoxyribonuclease RuvC
MIVLGIDPGSRKTGFGLIEAQGKAITYIASGVIKCDKGEISDRLMQIHQDVTEVIRTYQPDTSAIEQVFMHFSAGSALKLGQARGVAMAAMALAGLSVSEYSARQVKQSVVGYGAADKAQVSHMISQVLGVKHKLQEDAADALAIALCHYHSSQSLAKLGGAQKVVHGRLQ